MKHLLSILIVFFIQNCNAQTPEFITYLSNFTSIELPYTIDAKTYTTSFYSGNNYREISEYLLKKYLCIDSVNYPINPSEYRYDYGVKYVMGDNPVVLIHRQKYEGRTMYDFDLSEIILVVYSSVGELLSSQSICKDNDVWISSMHISNEKIKVQQIKLLEVNKPEMNCEIETKEYYVAPNGEINELCYEPTRNGIVIWSEQEESFILKK